MMTPSEVVEAVKEEFGVTLSRQLVWSYDPENNKDLSAELKGLFAETRKAWEDNAIQVRVADQKFRLNKLDALITKAERRQNLPLVAQLLEQAAKEVGGQFTNRQRVDQKVEAEVRGEVVTMTVDEFKRQEAERVKQAEQTMAEFGDEAPAGDAGE